MKLNLCQKILSPEQIQQLDQLTIQDEPITSIDLMERASERFVEAFCRSYAPDQEIAVLAGTGNNGGDGMVIARLLAEKGYSVQAFVIGNPEKGSPDFQANLQVLQAYLSPAYIHQRNDFPSLKMGQVVIDAIFGSGLSRAVTGLYGELIQHVNESNTLVVAVDIASGLGCNESFEMGEKMKVARTITFQLPKFSHLLPENDPFVGQLEIVDIGLHEGHLAEMDTFCFYVSSAFVRSLFRPRNKYAHKGTAGRCLLVTGSKGKMGAAMLAARACLRSGAGLLTTYVPASGNDIMQTAVPEAMTLTSAGDDFLGGEPDVSGYDSIGVGPGIDTRPETSEMLNTLIKEAKTALVLDADALNILAQNPDWLTRLPKGSVLTPHPGEFKRLVGEWKDDYDRHEKQVGFSKRYGLVLLLKGAHTCITTPDGLSFFNSTGNPGMATGGSGDVLTGMLTALMGQAYPPVEAAIVACYVHGLAGDLFVEKQGAMESLIASDLIEYLPSAFSQAQTGHS